MIRVDISMHTQTETSEPPNRPEAPPENIARCTCSRALAAILAACLALGHLAIAAAGSPALAARHAFIVGNGKYAHATALPNPPNDAGDIAARLKQLGYRVTLGLDLTRSELLTRFQQFTRALKADDLALIFYAGHGLQISGENYLVPVDARLVDQEHARTTLVSLNALMTDLAHATGNRIVILDACRNNPFVEEIARSTKTRGPATRGLARVFAGVGSYIAYSTQPGNVALDGTGRNSPFTSALLAHIGQTGADVHAVMRRVRAQVQSVTGSQQIPWENSSLIDDVSFVDDGSTTTASSKTDGPAAPTGQQQIAVAPAQRSEPRITQRLHYVSGLDPTGDNFLALRSGPGTTYPQLASMESGTLLRIVEARGDWRRVALTDGSEGWAHARWITCCRTITSATFSTLPAPKTTANDTCETLWHQRNAIWHRAGYCFKSARGQAAFGNAGCSRDEAAAQSAMSAADRARVAEFLARERALGCR
jgi:hypothetical protein